jgi:two-component system NarL family sensor kinase
MSDAESPIFACIFLIAITTTFVIAMVVLHRQRQVQNRQKLDFIKSEFERTLMNIENEIEQDMLTHIGRELHDNICQLLSLAKLNIKGGTEDEYKVGVWSAYIDVNQGLPVTKIMHGK